jgi:hypothetical protein
MSEEKFTRGEGADAYYVPGTDNKVCRAPDVPLFAAAAGAVVANTTTEPYCRPVVETTRSYTGPMCINPSLQQVPKLVLGGEVSEAQQQYAKAAAVANKVIKTKANDRQEGGSHYIGRAFQPWDYIIANDLGYMSGNIVKYVTRYPDKNGVGDITKALHYCDKLIETYRLKLGCQPLAVTAAEYCRSNKLGPLQSNVVELVSVYQFDIDRSLAMGKLIHARNMVSDLLERCRVEGVAAK